MEEREADEGAQHGHGDRTELDVGRMQLADLDSVDRIGSDDVRRQPGGRHQAACEQQCAVHERRRRSHQLQQDAGRHDSDCSGDACDQPELRVGLDEFGLGPHRRRHDRGFRHRVGLLQDERREDQREQQECVEVLGHQQGQHHPRRRDDLDHELAAAGHPVDRRADQRCHHQVRREADHEKQQHTRAGGVEIDVEEQRVGQRDHHGRVAAGHQGMGDRQPTELGGGRSLRSTDPVHRADPR
jgi:hypothetical protein